MKFKQSNYLWTAIVLVGIVLQSCIKDDLSGCPPNETKYLIGYRFTPDNGHDMKAEDAASMEIFVFDASGLFVGSFQDDTPRIDDDSYRIPLSLPRHTYTFVAWANTDAEHVYQADPAFLVKGKSRIDDASLSFKRPSRDVVNYVIDHLFYGQVQAVKPVAEATQEVIIPMVQNTYTLDVEIVGLQPEDGACLVLVSDNHTDYDFFNHRLESEEINYAKSCTIEGDMQRVLIRTLRLTEESPARLKIFQSDEGTPIYNESLIDLLLSASVKSGGVLDFARVHTYHIRIEFDPVGGTIAITINGWNVGEESHTITPQG